MSTATIVLSSLSFGLSILTLIVTSIIACKANKISRYLHTYNLLNVYGNKEFNDALKEVYAFRKLFIKDDTDVIDDGQRKNYIGKYYSIQEKG